MASTKKNIVLFGNITIIICGVVGMVACSIGLSGRYIYSYRWVYEPFPESSHPANQLLGMLNRFIQTYVWHDTLVVGILWVQLCCGFALVIAGGLGCFAISQSKRLVLKVSSVILGIISLIIFAESVVLLWAVDSRVMQLRGEIESTILDSSQFIATYKTDSVIEGATDTFQSDFSCCGWMNHTDWIFKPKTNASGNLKKLPESCCTGMSSCSITSEKRHIFGCRQAILSTLNNMLATDLPNAVDSLILSLCYVIFLVLNCLYIKGEKHESKKQLMKQLK